MDNVHTFVSQFVRDLDASADRLVPTSATFDELGIDSLSMVDLLFKVERAFSVSIPDEVLPQLSTVGDLLGYVANSAP